MSGDAADQLFQGFDRSAVARTSRATRRASWRGMGVRAASVDDISTTAAAVSGDVRHPA
jgi:hypothetical protein